MVKHIIIWKLDESLSAEEKQKVKKEAKAALEALCGTVPGLVSLTLHTEILPSSTGDMMLDSTLELSLIHIYFSLLAQRSYKAPQPPFQLP